MKNARTSTFSLFLYRKNDPVNNKHPKNNLNKILPYDSVSSAFTTSDTVAGTDEGTLSYPSCILLNKFFKLENVKAHPITVSITIVPYNEYLLCCNVTSVIFFFKFYI